MVRAFSLVMVVVAVLFAGQASAEDIRKLPDGDDLRERLRKAEQAHMKHDQELKSDQMHQLYSKESKYGTGAQSQKGQSASVGNGGEDAAPIDSAFEGDGQQTAQDIEKSGTGSGQKEDPAGGSNNNAQGNQTEAGGNGSADPSKQRSSGPLGNSDRYIPPSWKVLQGSGDFDTDQAKQQGTYFGIRMGTRITGEIRRVVTNVERNLCEIHVTQDVVGDYRTMAQGTILFCSKGLNPGTKRLEMAAVKGITPDGKEFTIQAYAMDITETAGLSGAITTDGKTVQRSVSEGAYEVSRQMVSALNDGSLVGAGVEAAADNALSEKETETDKTLGQPQYIITVAPQKTILRVEKTF